jgi:hypothetical protein
MAKSKYRLGDIWRTLVRRPNATFADCAGFRILPNKRWLTYGSRTSDQSTVSPKAAGILFFIGGLLIGKRVMSLRRHLAISRRLSLGSRFFRILQEHHFQ